MITNFKKRGHSHPIQSNPIQSMDESNPFPTLVITSRVYCTIQRGDGSWSPTQSRTLTRQA